MGFKSILIKPEYRSFSEDIVKNFYIPLLSQSVLYKRAVGFFSSSALIEISYGIAKLAENGGKIHLIASPRLQESDIEAISRGYEERNKVIERALVNSLEEPKNHYEISRFNLLADLIARGILDVKIAFTLGVGNKVGIYHEKLGLLYDSDGDVVAFTGSMNETSTAFTYNYETIDVFCSWTGDGERVSKKELAFNKLWNNSESNMEIMDFPKVALEKLQTYSNESPNYDIDIEEFKEFKEFDSEYSNTKKNEPLVPKDVALHDYQKEAIEKWANNGFRGIYDMATGTGKTFTGLGSLAEIYKRVGPKLATIIVCPYQHLVEQWVEDIERFNIKPIIGYSRSFQKDWKKKLQNAILDQRLDVKDKGFFCFICTNATFASDFVQGQVEKIRADSLIIVDEAHNFGSERLSSKLTEKYKYRLALSATLERHNDELGTEKLFRYFGDKCIEYSLERAIEEEKLTPYKYFPKIVSLNEKELSVYTDLSREIGKCIIKTKGGKTKLNSRGEKLALKRARLIAAASEKLEKLYDCIYPYKNKSHILVYCGAASLLGENDDYTTPADEELRQIDEVTTLLGEKLDMKVSQFTSKEDIEERGTLKEQFQKGENLQTLIAIKCLDEGVNIPNIKTAFILASTTNPKEYIQRRGRVLRKAEGKDYAEIYDFVTIPRPLNEVSSLTLLEAQKDLSLVENELMRIEEFSKGSINPMDADKVISDLKEAYNIDCI